MASLLGVATLALGLLPDKIRTDIFRVANAGLERDLSVSFTGLTRDEASVLIDAAIKIEQARNGDVLTPTEYRNRFSGLDFDVE